MAGTRSGGCLCGLVRYEAPAVPLGVSICHCRDCQKQAGSAFSIIAVFPRDAIRFTGTTSLYEGQGDSGEPVLRHFCGRCGSPLYSDNGAMRARGIIAIKAGTLDDVSDLVPMRHFWADSRQPGIEIPEGTPCTGRQ
jgi:hypothetical protein